MAQWVESAIEHASLGQSDLARLLADRLGTNFDRSKVYKILKDQREVSAEEMLAIEVITGFPAPAALRRGAKADPEEEEFLRLLLNADEDVKRSVLLLLRRGQKPSETHEPALSSQDQPPSKQS